MTTSYRTNLTDEQWEIIKTLVPEAKPGGRPRTVDMRELLNCAKQIKGRKRHVLVDTLGLLIVVVVTAANLPARAGAKLVFAQVKQERTKFWRLVKIWVDGGYRREEFMKWVMDTYRWILETVLRSAQQKGFKILPQRWVVERTFGWFNW